MRAGMHPALTSQELAAAGEALYGANWRAELSRALGLSDQALLRAVEEGRIRAPSEWRARLIALAQDAALRAMEVASTLIWREPAQQTDTATPAFTTPRLV
jgi:hypothetical protein